MAGPGGRSSVSTVFTAIRRRNSTGFLVPAADGMCAYAKTVGFPCLKGMCYGEEDEACTLSRGQYASVRLAWFRRVKSFLEELELLGVSGQWHFN